MNVPLSPRHEHSSAIEQDLQGMIPLRQKSVTDNLATFGQEVHHMEHLEHKKFTVEVVVEAAVAAMVVAARATITVAAT
eukprot:10078093-Ditylum_brightwellii.AAC.1